MSIQARKLSLIEEFLKISDEKLITKLELFLKTERSNEIETDITPMTMDEFHDMIYQAKKESSEGKVVSHEELQKKIKKWK